MPTEPYTPTLLDRVVAVAHECWCRKMKANGWRNGRCDADAKYHDAIVDFNRLPHERICQALRCIAAANVEQILADAIDYPFGSGRPFTLGEMRIGLPVRWAPGTQFADDLSLPLDARGRVISWKTDANGVDLERFFVEWDAGTTTEHDPVLSDLWRAETASSSQYPRFARSRPR